MECKAFYRYNLPYSYYHWNISRMECKVFTIPHASSSVIIGIYPEWNVKFLNRFKQAWATNWNISRMECKVAFRTACAIV